MDGRFPLVGRLASIIALLLAAASLSGCGSRQYVRPHGPYANATPSGAAERRFDAYLAVWNHNVPQERPRRMGSCSLLHRQPWIAYRCPFAIRASKPCPSSVVMAVRWHPDLRAYVAMAVRTEFGC